jgi:copper resistance protein B
MRGLLVFGLFALASGAAADPAVMTHDRAADLYFDPTVMQKSEAAMMDAHNAPVFSQVMINRLERDFASRGEGYAFDGEAWIGDANRLVLRTEGDGDVRGAASGDVEALVSRPLDPWFNVEAGVRRDFGHGGERSYVTGAVEGLSPYAFHVLAAAYLSDRGEASARLEANHDFRLTQRWILQPRIETNLVRKDSDAEFGLRLRYEIRPELAPYLGLAVSWRARPQGAEDTVASLVVGVRGWF